MKQIPKHFEDFTKKWPKVAEAYDSLGEAVANSGPLDEKTRALIKLGFSTGCRMESAVKSHARKAVEAGATRAEIVQAVMLGMTTVGFPTAMAGLKWVESAIGEE